MKEEPFPKGVFHRDYQRITFESDPNVPRVNSPLKKLKRVRLFLDNYNILPVKTLPKKITKNTIPESTTIHLYFFPFDPKNP